MNKKNRSIRTLMGNQLYSEDQGDMIEIVADAEEDEESLKDIGDVLPILPIKNTVLFPGVVLPITVSKDKSIKLVKKIYKSDQPLGIISQKQNVEDEAGPEDLYFIGTVARILKILVLPDGNTTIIIQGRARFEVMEWIDEHPNIKAKISLLGENFPVLPHDDMEMIMKSLKESAFKIMKLNPDIPNEAQEAIKNINSPAFLTHFLSSNLSAEVNEKQKLLELHEGIERAELLLEFMIKDIQMLELRLEIHNKVSSDIDQQQRDYYLRQQMKVLQDELGEEGPDREIEKLKQRAKKKKWSKELLKHFTKEIDKASRMNPASAEFPIAINYCELLLDLPWDEYTQDNFDLNRAKEILDKDHFGMEKVKERIIEFLAVLKLKNDLKGPILCLYGPPGVGKTSLGRSVAEALGRKYIRMSLGGLHDEAEIRGHRKTYVGAMPGKVIQNIKKAGSSNPVFILDEIDKIDSGHRGDPSSALLEVLDPEQNNTFSDNFLEVDYDLSKVLFVATANSLDTIQPALRDRMEIIELSGYTVEEKVQIAQKHLVPKLRKEHGVKGKQLAFDKSALQVIVERYTRESGVRGLERMIAKVIRKVAKFIAMEEKYPKKIMASHVRDILGAEIFDIEDYTDEGIAGVVTGLAWTPAGGEILLIESALSRGKGKLTLSGQLGDVMKESALTGLSFIRSHAEELGIDHRVFDQYDVHIHVPAGAVPKDGPSAGITLVTSLTSIFTQRKIKSRIAMTGEVTLRGKVLPVGGIKEKVLAAKRSGIEEIILCEKNKKDIEEINASYLEGLNIHYVEHVEDVLKIALLDEKVKNPRTFEFKEESTNA
ncbi:MAG: endopeptidase La [Cyclobacteriaceae bacterium]|nr:endopeptidase La [Cyclobacteriaceae bacterium]MCH8516862.1 endopeptidase La [Cyclobacteriaceae bacterium]